MTQSRRIPANRHSVYLLMYFAAPPMQGRGDNYRTRYVTLYEKHLFHQGVLRETIPSQIQGCFFGRGSNFRRIFFRRKETKQSRYSGCSADRSKI